MYAREKEEKSGDGGLAPPFQLETGTLVVRATKVLNWCCDQARFLGKKTETLFARYGIFSAILIMYFFNFLRYVA